MRFTAKYMNRRHRVAEILMKMEVKHNAQDQWENQRIEWKILGNYLIRLMDYIFRDYKFHCIIVFILIFVGVIANVQGTMFTRDLIDKYITPFLLSSDTPNFTPLAHAIGKVAGILWSRNRCDLRL